MKIKIHPLSVNKAYRGRRFATKDLLQFKKDLSLLFPRNREFMKGKLAVKYVFGLSTKNADGDNCVKAFQDCMADHYGFNDRDIYEWHIKKVDVKKGEEFIEYEISTIRA